MKKIISLVLVMSLLLSIGVVSFANADAGIKSFEISEEEEIRFREERGIPLPTKEVIPVEKRIVESVQLINKESKKNKDGSEEIVAYYRPTFKDTKEAKKMLKELDWEHAIFHYTSDGTQIGYDNRSYYPSNNYMPIIWKPTQNFHDTDEIYSISLNNYLNSTSVYFDRDDHSNLTNDWKTRGQFDYTPQ